MTTCERHPERQGPVPYPRRVPEQTPVPVAVLISGAGSNLAALLEAAAAPGATFAVVGVVADLEAPGLEHARSAGVPVRVVSPGDHVDRAAWDVALAVAVRELSPRLVVLAGFMRIVGAPLLDAFPGRILNTHPALLPSFPGAHGVRDALAYGVKVTGVSVIEVDAGVDTGRILAQRAVDVLDGDTQGSLHERIKDVERPLLVEVVTALTAASPTPDAPPPASPTPARATSVST